MRRRDGVERTEPRLASRRRLSATSRAAVSSGRGDEYQHDRAPAWLTGWREPPPQSVPRRVLEEAKNQILSMIAAVHAGHFSDAGRVVSRTVKEWTGGKEATLIPSGERTGVHCARSSATPRSAWRSTTTTTCSAAHTGPSAVLVTLALAEKVGVSGQEFLLAQVVANEVGGRARAGDVALGAVDDQVTSFVHLARRRGDRRQAAGARRASRPSTRSASRWLQPGCCRCRPAFFGSEAQGRCSRR